MESRDRLKKSPSGSEGHGIHVCNKCGWPFPNPRPSSKNRKAHKRVCGTIEGYKIGENKAYLDVSDDEHLSDNDSKTIGSETMEKAAQMAVVSSRSFSGFGGGSNRSTRSEEDVFSDAVTDFGDASGVLDSDDVREPARKQDISENDRVAKAVADAGDSNIQQQTVDYSRPEKKKVDIDLPSQHHLSSSTLDCSPNSGSATREEESSVTENMFQSSEISVVLDSEEKGSPEGVLDEKSEDIAIISTENAGITSETVFGPQKVNGEYVLAPEDAAMELIRKDSEVFDERYYSFSKDYFDVQMNSLENPSEAIEDANIKAGSFHVPVIERLSIGSLAEPSESDNKISNDIISEALHQEVSVERNSEKNDTHAADADISRPDSVVLHPDKDINEAGQGKVVTEEQNPLVFADTNLQSVLDDSDIHTHSINSVKPDNDDSECDSEALEGDSARVEEEELLLTNETSFISDIHISTEKNLLGGGDGDDYDVRSTEGEKLSVTTPTVPKLEDLVDDKVEVERKYGHVLEVAASESSNASLLQCDVQTKEHQDSEAAAVRDFGNSSEHIVVGESTGAVVANVISSEGDKVNVTEQKYNDENCVQKASDFVDDILAEKVKDNDAQLEKIDISGVNDRENVGDKMPGGECIGKVDLGLISDNDDDIEVTQNAANGFNTGLHGEEVPAVDDHFANEGDGTGSPNIDRDRKLVKQEEAVSELDVQSDLISQADSLEGNWGSFSVLSTLSDAPAATDTGSQPSQESLKAEKDNLKPKSDNGKSDIFQTPSYMLSVEQKADGSDQNEGALESQTSQIPQEHGVRIPSLNPTANESPGRKRNEEIIAKVTNWSTEKHMSLKSYLGEPSPSAKDNPPPPISQETKNTVMRTKEPVDDGVRGDLGKEWNSPARYPANIKREKGKVRSRPLWAPFICCSSVRTS